CGVWLSEIEKALVRNGFRVVSWDALRTIEENERIPPYKAAAKLGADVVFLFNSLEVNPVSAGGENAYRISYFDSDKYGHRGAPHLMTASERSELRQAVQARSRSIGDQNGTSVLSSTLDATAIQTANGESIWFYRNTALKTLSADAGKAFLFARPQGQGWFLAEAQSESSGVASAVAPPPPEELSAVDSGGSSVAANVDPHAVQRLELMRAVTQDFVDSFRSGKDGDK
ncbi:MAG: hypothetical protein MK135_11065, partial [Polyangiaceae bacterium]|nr:hypothetical protein [Polyangiaceae bacterium]